MAARRSPGTPATTALDRAGIRYVAHAYEHDPSVTDYGDEAVAAMGVDAARVLKTLVVDTGSGLAVGVVPVSHRLDLKAMAAELGIKKAALAGTGAAERSTGYVIGGISPIGQKKSLTTLVDESVTAFPTIFVSGGRRGLDLELSPSDLLLACSGRLAPIAR